MRVSFYSTLACSIGLMVASFLMPPMGVIDPSVVECVGWLFAFGSLGVVPSAIKEGIDAKFTRGNTTIEIDTRDEGVA